MKLKSIWPLQINPATRAAPNTHFANAIHQLFLACWGRPDAGAVLGLDFITTGFYDDSKLGMQPLPYFVPVRLTRVAKNQRAT